MTDEIDTGAEALALARYESGLPLLSNVGEEPAPPGTVVSEGPEGVAELTIALVNDHGRVSDRDGTPGLRRRSWASGTRPGSTPRTPYSG